MGEQLVQLQGVHKSFGQNHVLRGIDLTVSSGEIVSLLGINGAGKTTMINMILGLEAATKGSVHLMGGDPRVPKNRVAIGVTPQSANFLPTLKAREVLSLVQAHYPNPLSLDELAEQFGLEAFLDQLLGGLSGGQKRRVALAAAFVGRPKIVFLDEPTTGLDAESRQRIWQSIRHYVDEGGTLFLTTHYLEEAEAVASRIVVLQEGQIKVEGSVDEIRAMSGAVRVRFNAPAMPDGIVGVEKMEHKDGHYVLHTHDPDTLVKNLVKTQVDFSHLRIDENTLEMAFMKMAKEARQ